MATSALYFSTSGDPIWFVFAFYYYYKAKAWPGLALPSLRLLLFLLVLPKLLLLTIWLAPQISSTLFSIFTSQCLCIILCVCIYMHRERESSSWMVGHSSCPFRWAGPKLGPWDSEFVMWMSLEISYYMKCTKMLFRKLS